MPSRTDRVEERARRYVELGAYASIEWLVFHEGREWLRGRVGTADPANNVPLPEKPIYRLYSMTKPVVSAVAMMLVEEGRLRLYDFVATYLPKFAKLQIVDRDGGMRPAKKPMIVEHLLSHKAGLSYGFLPDCPAAAHYRKTDLRSNAGPLEGMIDTIASLPLAFEPGTAWQYSVATDVVARIVEIIEGKPIQQVVHERVIAPLGLKDTGYMVPEGQRHRVMPVFGTGNLDALFEIPEGPQKLTPADVSRTYPVGDPAFGRGGYGLFSTADDYAVIADFLATGRSPSGETLLARQTVRAMWTSRTPPPIMPLWLGPLLLPGYGFSLAGRVMVDPGAALSIMGPGEFGWSGAASTFYWTDPGEKLTGIVMSQYLGSRYPLADDMRNAVYQAVA